MEQVVLIVTVFTFLSVALGGLGIRLVRAGRQEQRVKERISALSPDPVDPGVNATVVRDMKLSAVPAVDRMLQGMRLVHRAQTLLIQADVNMRAGPFCLLILTLACLGAYVAGYVFHNLLLVLPAAIVPALIPILVVYRKKTRRLQLFEERLPDALDLMTGALRSGMAFTGALQVVAQESPPPISKEFTIVFEEHRLGLDLAESLKNMTQRVDSQELRIFVTAVLLQRETGGNLAEILEGTAQIIRDRFRILGDVRTLTAQARLSGVILAILPIALAVVLQIIAPGYLQILTKDRLGVILIFVAVALQIVGYFVIRRIIAIKV
jgi:tight adherence protein B